MSVGVWIMSGWCLRVSWEASIPNQENIFGHNAQILPFLPVPYIAQKMPMSWVSEFYLGVSAQGLRVSGDELMQNIFAQIYIGHVILDNAFYSSTC